MAPCLRRNFQCKQLSHSIFPINVPFSWNPMHGLAHRYVSSDSSKQNCSLCTIEFPGKKAKSIKCLYSHEWLSCAQLCLQMLNSRGVPLLSEIKCRHSQSTASCSIATGVAATQVCLGWRNFSNMRWKGAAMNLRHFFTPRLLVGVLYCHPMLYILYKGLWHKKTEKEKIVQNLLFAELITGDLEPVFHVAGGSGSERAIKKDIWRPLHLLLNSCLCNNNGTATRGEKI